MIKETLVDLLMLKSNMNLVSKLKYIKKKNTSWYRSDLKKFKTLSNNDDFDINDYICDDLYEEENHPQATGVEGQNFTSMITNN